MKIERKVSDTGAITDVIHLSAEDNAALDEAQQIIAKRAVAENGSYDKEMTEYWLQGLLLREGINKMLEIARTAPFQMLQKIYRGYC